MIWRLSRIELTPLAKRRMTMLMMMVSVAMIDENMVRNRCFLLARKMP